jgi:hypothetical protein
MKKLLVLSVLLGLMALPMFASDVSFGGDVTFGFIGDFGDNENEVMDTSVDLMATIDDYNSLTINTDDLEFGDWDGITKILVTTDVGAVFGLPVGVVVNWGYDDPDMNEFQNISDYGNEDPWDFSPAEYWGLDFLVSYNFLELEFAFNPTATVVDPLDTHGLGGPFPADAGALLVGVAAKEPIAGLNAEVYYFQNGSAFDEYGEGRIGFDAAYSMEVAGFAINAGAYFGYDLLDTATNAWAYGVGLKGAYSMATVTVGLDGNETDALNGITATGVVAPIDQLGIYAGLWYDAANSELVEVDLGVNPHLGAVEMYLGYLIDGDSPAHDSGDNFNAPPGIGDSGAYIKFDVDY